MAFRLYNDGLTPLDTLAIHIDPHARVVSAEDIASLREAAQIIDDARDQAARIVGGAQDAYDAERQRGYEDGRKEALLEQAEQMIEHVGRTVDYFSRVEGRMVELVMMAVQRIIADFDDRERALIVVRNALSVVRNQKQMTLRLNPAQVEGVRERLNDLLASYPGVTYLDVVSDGRVELDACILESEIGMVEASIAGQIEAIRGAFAKILGSRA